MNRPNISAVAILTLFMGAGLLGGCRGGQAFRVSGGFSRTACQQCGSRSARTATLQTQATTDLAEADHQLSKQEQTIQPELDSATANNRLVARRNPFGSVIDVNPELAEALQTSPRTCPRLESFTQRQPTPAKQPAVAIEPEQSLVKSTEPAELETESNSLPTSEKLAGQSECDENNETPIQLSKNEMPRAAQEPLPLVDGAGPVNELRNRQPESLVEWMDDMRHESKQAELTTSIDSDPDVVLHARANIPYQSLRTHRVELLNAKLTHPTIPASPQVDWELAVDSGRDQDSNLGVWEFRPLPAGSTSGPAGSIGKSVLNDQIRFTPLPASDESKSHANTAFQKPAALGGINVNVIAPEPDTNPATAARPIQKPTDRR